MERIIILTRTTKKEGNIKLRFRLYDGRDFELFHKSQISVSLEDLKKFNIDGSWKYRSLLTPAAKIALTPENYFNLTQPSNE